MRIEIPDIEPVFDIESETVEADTVPIAYVMTVTLWGYRIYGQTYRVAQPEDLKRYPLPCNLVEDYHEAVSHMRADFAKHLCEVLNRPDPTALY